MNPPGAHTTAQLRADHHEETSALQHGVDRLTRLVARPWFVAMLIVGVGAWALGNGAAWLLGLPAWDPPPFAGLEVACGCAALFIAVLILTSQRRQDELSSHREQLALELAILNDQKASKIIALLEELRRDSPTLANRLDQAAQAMSKPSDTRSVLEAIKNPGGEESQVTLRE